MATVITSDHAPRGASDLLTKIHEALRLVHDPHTSNEARRQAQEFLELVKSYDEAPLRGFELATDQNQTSPIRHYALSLLEHAIRHRWGGYSEEQSVTLRKWVINLCHAVNGTEPGYIKTKAVQLWIEIIKRSWGAEWMDMDETLCQLFYSPGPRAHQEIALCIVETISEEVFNGDDPVVAMRETILSRACVEIFTPSADLQEAFPNRQNLAAIRCGHDGWLGRTTNLLRQCLDTGVTSSPDTKITAVRGIAVLTSSLAWLIPRAVLSTSCIDVLTTALAAPDVDIQKAALEALHVLYSRTGLGDQELMDMVIPMFHPSMVSLYTRLVKWSSIVADDIDDDRYQFAKKLAELLSSIGSFLERRLQLISSTDTDIEGFLYVLLDVARNQSTMVSIPAVVAWNRLLSGNVLDVVSDRGRYIAPLLDICSSRLIRYEHLSPESKDPTFVFLLEDTDTVPERHTFLGNYRRYASGVIQSIAQLEPTEVLQHVLAKSSEALSLVSNGIYSPNKLDYSRHALPILRIDAQLSVLEAVFKGYMKWRKAARAQTRSQDHEDASLIESTQSTIERHLESWCNNLLDQHFDDPQIRKRILQLLVFLSTTVLDKNAGFMLKVLEHILMTWPTLEPRYRDYNESIKELQSESTVELQRLALEMPDHLLNVYDQLEARVLTMIASGTLDEKRSIAYRSFLFIIVHRATMLEPAMKVDKLRQFVTPIMDAWHDDNLKRSLASFPSFCQLIGLDKAQRYLADRNVHQIANWGGVELDAHGLALQEEMETRIKLLPLRATKSLLMNSVERLDRSSPTFQVSQALWEEGLPSVLSDLLRILR
jgi:exportin-5